MAGRNHARTWWAQEWLAALQASVTHDLTRFSRGRTLARNGAVSGLRIGAGFVSATVTDPDGDEFVADLSITQLSASEWDQLVVAIGSRASHAAALLDGELDPAIVQDAASIDVHLLPRATDIRPDCSCTDWAEPCKHASAIAHSVAEALDDDAFVLFLLRGMASEDLLTRIQSYRFAESGSDQTITPRDTEETLETFEGTDAADAWSGRRPGDPLDALPEIASHTSTAPPKEPGHRPQWDVELPPEMYLDAESIDALGDDAVLRAWSMLRNGTASGLGIPAKADLARRAAGLEGRAVDRLADRAALPADQLRSYAKAWPLGGAIGVEMIIDQSRWQKDQEQLARAREELVGLGYAKSAIALSYNSLRIEGDVFLALGPDDRWYRITASGRRAQNELERPPANSVSELVDPSA